MSADTSTVAYLFDRVYSDKAIADAATRDRPFSRMVKKSKGLQGENFRYKIKYGNAGSVGGTFATTQAAAGTSKGVQVAVEPALKYGIIQLDGPSLLRSQGKGATIELITNETDSVLDEMYAHLSFDLLHSGNGIRGRRSSASSDVITLTDANDVRNFSVGMPVGASDQADGSSPRTGTTTVSHVDPSAGTITLTSAAAITSFANNDYLFVPGEPGTCVDGLGLLVPLTAPSSGESFRGHDRSVDTQRLAGARLNNTSAPIHENIGTLATMIQSQGRKADTCFLSPTNLWKVVRHLEAKVQYDGAANSASYGFEFVTIMTPGGAIRLFSDPDMPEDVGYVGKMSEAEVLFCGDQYVHMIRDAGTGVPKHLGDADGLELRARSMSQPVLYMPGAWGVFAI